MRRRGGDRTAARGPSAAPPARRPRARPDRSSGPVAAARRRALRGFVLEYNNPRPTRPSVCCGRARVRRKQVIPQSALFPHGGRRRRSGAGLNVTLLRDDDDGRTTRSSPISTTSLVGGMVARSLADAAIGQLGTPLVDVLASPVDAASGKPSPPTRGAPALRARRSFVNGSDDRPRHRHRRRDGRLGAHRSQRWRRGRDRCRSRRTAPSSAPCRIAHRRVRSLKLVQHDLRARPASRPTRARRATRSRGRSRSRWRPRRPSRRSSCRPRDPTHSPRPPPTRVRRRRPGDAGRRAHRGPGPHRPRRVLRHHRPTADGAFSGLDHAANRRRRRSATRAGTSWCSTRAATASPPVFVSVGIDPPTVEFPRNGAELKCDEAPDPSPADRARPGRFPIPEKKFGRAARVRGDRARALGLVGDRDPDLTSQPPQPGTPLQFESHLSVPARAGTSSTSSRRPSRRRTPTPAGDATRTSAPTRASPTRRPAASSST